MRKIMLSFLLIFALLLIGALTGSGLFAGQHSWYSLSGTGNDVSCDKCHQYIYDDYEIAGNVHYNSGMACDDCHRNESFATHAKGDGAGSISGKEAHAASIPNCTLCHANDVTDLTSTNETHKSLYVKGNTSGPEDEGNEACVMCHTGFDKRLNFTRALYVEYDLVNPGGGYEVQNFSFVSTNETIIDLTPTGGKHKWENASDIDCFDCHSDVKSALENGGHVPRSDRETMGMPAQGHLGRHHNFDRSSVTISSCRSCHLPDLANFGSGYTHPEAQLDYHAATTEHCYNCHYNGTGGAPGGGRCNACHDRLRSGFHDNILDNMFSQSFCMYQIDKVCIGCHKSGYGTIPGAFGDKHFKVYTEPSTTVTVE